MAYDSESKPVNADLLVLQRARDRVAKGWCQLAYGFNGGPVCATGALVNEGADDLRRFNAMLGFHMSPHDLEDYLTTWNDRPGRTKAEVLERFDQAIDRLARS